MVPLLKGTKEKKPTPKVVEEESFRIDSPGSMLNREFFFIGIGPIDISTVVWVGSIAAGSALTFKAIMKAPLPQKIRKVTKNPLEQLKLKVPDVDLAVESSSVKAFQAEIPPSLIQDEPFEIVQSDDSFLNLVDIEAEQDAAADREQKAAIEMGIRLANNAARVEQEKAALEIIKATEDLQLAAELGLDTRVGPSKLSLLRASEEEIEAAGRQQEINEAQAFAKMTPVQQKRELKKRVKKARAMKLHKIREDNRSVDNKVRSERSERERLKAAQGTLKRVRQEEAIRAEEIKLQMDVQQQNIRNALESSRTDALRRRDDVRKQAQLSDHSSAMQMSQQSLQAQIARDEILMVEIATEIRNLTIMFNELQIKKAEINNRERIRTALRDQRDILENQVDRAGFFKKFQVEGQIREIENKLALVDDIPDALSSEENQLFTELQTNINSMKSTLKNQKLMIVKLKEELKRLG